MTTKHVQPGNRITYANSTGSTIPVNTVLAIGNLLAIASVDIPDGESGECEIGAVYECPKVAAAVIGQGETVIFDIDAGTAGEFDDNAATPATGDIVDGAVAWEAAGNGETTVKVFLLQSGGTVTA